MMEIRWEGHNPYPTLEMAMRKLLYHTIGRAGMCDGNPAIVLTSVEQCTKYTQTDRMLEGMAVIVCKDTEEEIEQAKKAYGSNVYITINCKPQWSDKRGRILGEL